MEQEADRSAAGVVLGAVGSIFDSWGAGQRQWAKNSHYPMDGAQLHRTHGLGLCLDD
jgi:photosystem II stability/assembly factor-like uncharacterized protein